VPGSEVCREHEVRPIHVLSVGSLRVTPVELVSELADKVIAETGRKFVACYQVDLIAESLEPLLELALLMLVFVLLFVPGVPCHSLSS
jgi:hypothetical protein